MVKNLSKKQVSFTEISPSEFFYRNRDLAGFSNPSRALYFATRELVENSLDACEQTRILPNIFVRIIPESVNGDLSDPKSYILKIQDNGPGVDPKYVPNAFARVFYGSKFHLRQARGMFGMGGTMSILYGQITTNRPVLITTSIDGVKATIFEMMINIQNNSPRILNKTVVDANGVTGTSVQITLIGDYTRGSQKIHDYFKETALVTPYANIVYADALGRISYYERVTDKMPNSPKETLPHPHGIDVEALRRLLTQATEKNLIKFLQKNFHRVGERISRKFLEYAGLPLNTKPSELNNDQMVKFGNALHSFKEFLQPDASCLSPLGNEILDVGITKELQPEFSAVTQRPPSAYSGFPFIVEVGLAYGGKILPAGIRIMRFANRIPLLYDERNDIAWKIVNEEIDWRRYKIPQDAPLTIVTHVCSTKIPYKTVGKEYLADRPELEKELKNAVREVVRRLGIHLSKKGSMEAVKRKMNIYGRYLPLVAKFSADIIKAEKLPRYRKLLERKKENNIKAETSNVLEEKKPQENIKEDVEQKVDNNEKINEEKIVGRQRTIEEYS